MLDYWVDFFWHMNQQHHRDIKDPIKKKKWQRHCKRIMKRSIYEFSDGYPNHCSQAVWDMCLKADINPFELVWKDRNVFDKIDGKSALLWEHTTPNGIFCQELYDCTSPTEIREKLANYSGVCWVTRAEDNKLNKLGYRSKRPGGWRKCYEEAGIKLYERTK